MNLKNAILEAMSCYIGMTENDRSYYQPEKMRTFIVLLKMAEEKPDMWQPLHEWVSHNLNGSSYEYMMSIMPKKAKSKKEETTDEN